MLDTKYYLNLRNTLDNEKLIMEYNKELIGAYPWLKPYNGYDPLYIHPEGENPNYDYQWTMLDDMPDGWRLAFGKQLCDEIQEQYDKLSDEDKEKFYLFQVKEKFGGLRIYTSSYKKSIEEIIQKYSQLSEKICIVCGKPATYISKGWICPWCDDHIARDRINEYVKIEKWFEENN